MAETIEQFVARNRDPRPLRPEVAAEIRRLFSAPLPPLPRTAAEPASGVAK